MRKVIITLHDEKPMSWNQMYSGIHWSKRSAEKERVLWVMRSAMPEGCEVFTQPVAITLTAYFSGKRYDPDNLCDKFYIDGLKGWLLANDSSVQVESVTTRCLQDKRKPRLEIVVEEKQP